MIARIRLWWKFEGRYYGKDFIRGIKNLIRWFPIIWKDRDWDSHFIFQLLIQKLKNQSKYIGDKNRHTRAKRDAEIMMTCVRLMERIDSDYYIMEWMDYHESDYNWIDTNKPDSKQLDIVELSEKFDDYFSKYQLAYKRVIKEQTNKDKKTIAMTVARENHYRARRILFILMENNLESWWD